MSLVSSLGFVIHAYNLSYALGYESLSAISTGLFSSGAILFLRCLVLLFEKYGNERIMELLSVVNPSLSLFDAGFFHVINFVFCLSLLLYLCLSDLPHLLRFLIFILYVGFFIGVGIFV
ncbi:hypothetical protein GEMRC1_004368 [Eukaryota sp. GEM-RC1]